MKDSLNDLFGSELLRKRKAVTFVAICVFLLIVVLILSWYFNASQKTAITVSSRAANQISIRTVGKLDETFENAQSVIELGATAIGKSGSERAYNAGAVYSYTKSIEDANRFTIVSVISSDGYLHRSNGDTINVKDRDYYIDGMSGNAGYTFVKSSKLSGEPLYGYYTPIFKQADPEQEIVGVLVGFFGQEALADILQVGEESYGTKIALCIPDGTIIAVNEEFVPVGGSIFDVPEDSFNFLEKDTLSKMHIAFDKKEDFLFNYRGAYGISAGNVLTINSGNLMALQVISSENISELQSGITNLGKLLILLMAVAFLLFFTFVYLYEQRYRNQLSKVSRNISYVASAVEMDYECFIVLDFVKDTYEYITGNGYILKQLPSTGYSDFLREFFITLLANEEDKKTVGRLAKKAKLQDMLSRRREYKDCFKIEVNGVQKWENINLLAIERDESKDNLVKKVLLTVQDATDYKQKEDEIIHRAELIHILLGNFSSAYEVNLNTGECKTLRLSEYATNKLGDNFLDNLSHEERCRHYAEHCLPEDYREGFVEISSLEYMRSALKDQQYFTYTYLEEKDKNNPCYVQLKVARINDKVDSVVCGFSDVNEEMKMQIKQRSLLMNALNQAENANMAKTAFLSNMSHDIRTPMNAVLGFTSLAKIHLDETEKVQEYLTKVENSGKYLLSLINDILDMSRIESGKVSLEETVCSLSSIIEETSIMFKEQALHKQISLNVDTYGIIDDNVYLDKLRMSQILQNIISNSIKFTHEGGVVDIRARQTAESGRDEAGYEIIIRDSGIGMTPEFLEHIWEPFEREKNTTVSGITGTGLGTAIVKNLVDMMGGEVSVESEPDKGTTFRIRLVLRLEEERLKEARLAKSSQSHSAGGPVRTPMPARGFLEEEEALGIKEETDIALKEAKEKIQKGYTVGTYKAVQEELQKNFSEEEIDELVRNTFSGKHFLLVEDNELNREIGMELLKDQGAIVDVAEDGDIAVEMLKEKPAGTYDLIFMDIQMPRMNGYEAARIIRSLEDNSRANVPIVAMTANAFAEDVDAAFEAGMNGHISKPVSIEKIYATINNII